MRLALNDHDDLAWRTILDCSRNGIGAGTITSIEAVGDAASQSFGGAIAIVAKDPTKVARGDRVKREYDSVHARLAHVVASGSLSVEDTVQAFHGSLPPSSELDAARDELVGLARSYASIGDLAEFLTAIALKKEEEQALVAGTVNIMTMHRAKGLDACVVFVAAAEEEMYIRDAAGRNEARRLFYVSITRAKHALFITHATVRDGMQRQLGANVKGSRQRTSFLLTRGASRPGVPFSRDFAVDPRLLS
jgi:DNA helicase-2/ATP-dependent DNA helicase PcrA